jgi:hypothetical protein
MKYARFDKITEHVYNSLLDGKSISEDDLHVFSEEIFNFMQEKAFNNNNLPQKFELLLIYLEQSFDNSIADTGLVSKVFTYGFLLGNMELINLKNQKEKQKK